MSLRFLRPTVRFLYPMLLGTLLLTISVPCAEADTYQRTKAGGDFNDPPDPSHSAGYPWMDETPFGSGGTTPGAGDTAIVGSYDDPASPTGPDGYTLTGSATVATLEIGNVTLTGNFTATKEMDFGGYGSAVDLLLGGTYNTAALNGGVVMQGGASLTATGDSSIDADMTGGSSLSGTTSSALSGTVDGSTLLFSGMVYIYGVTVQNGGKFTSGDATTGAVFVKAGGSWMVNGAINANLSSPNITGGGTVTSQSADLEDSGFYGVGQGQGFVVSGAGSKWTNTGAVGIGVDGKDEGALTVMGGGMAAISGAVTMGGTKGGDGEIFLQDPGSTLTTGALTAPTGSVEVTKGAKFTTQSAALLDDQANVGLDSLVSGAGSLWHTAGGLTLGYGAATYATYVLTGGLLQVDGDLTLADSSILSNATLQVTGANSLQVGGGGNIGKVGTGELDVYGDGSTGAVATFGGTLMIGGSPANTTAGAIGSVVVGDQAALTLSGADAGILLAASQYDQGQFLVTGSGTTATEPGVLVIGEGGTAQVGVTGGATLTAGMAAVEPNDLGSEGELDVFDPGSVCTLASLDALGYAAGTPTPKAATVAANNYGKLQILAEFEISSGAAIYVSAAVPANANMAYKYSVVPSDKTHPGGQIFVGTDTYGPDGTIRVGHGGTLSGQAGMLTGNVAVGAGGKFKPGNGSGTFTVTGDCDLSDAGAGGGETDIQFGGTGMADDDKPGTDFDQLIVTGTATLGGTLSVSFRPGYTPKAGDEFHVIHAGAFAGAFAEIVGPGITLVSKIDEDDFVLTVTEVAIGSPPDITSPATATAAVGQPFIYQIVATNGAFSYNATGLPGGLSINTTTGLISGTPTTAGVYQVGLAATSSDHEGDGTLTLTVLPAPPPGSPVVSSVLAASAQVGTAFNYQIAASNAPTGYNATGLPTGLGINGLTGLISGTPTASGVFSVVLAATNATGTGTATLILTVTGPTVPTVTASATVKVAHVEAGTPGVFTISLSAPQAAKTVIKYTLKGSAVNGQDYDLLSGKAKIKPGKTSTMVQVVPRASLSSTASKTVKLVITPSSAFEVGNSTAPKIKIKP